MFTLFFMKQNACFHFIKFGSLCFSILFLFFSCNDPHPKTSTVPDKKEKPYLLYEKTLDSLLDSDLSKALSYVQLLLEQDSIKSRPQLYFMIVEKAGSVMAYLGNTDSSLVYYEKALDFWKSDSTSTGKEHYGILLSNIGLNYFTKGDLTRALKVFEELLAFSSGFHSLNLKINSHLNLSDVYQGLGDYGKALGHIEQCIKLCIDNRDSVKMVNALNSYALLYSNCRLFEEAEKQFELELKYRKHFSPYMEFNYYNSKGRMFYLKEDYARAKTEFLNGLAIVSPNDTYAYMILISNLAETCLLLNHSDSAKVYLDKLSKIEMGLASMPIFDYNYNSLLGEYYLQMQQFEKAKNAFERADLIARDINVDQVIRKLHLQRKTRFLLSTNNFKEASQHLQDYIKLNEVILQEDNLKLVAGLKYKFERDTTVINQRSELALKEQQLKSYRFRNLILVVSLLVLLMLTGLIILYTRKSKALNYEKNMRRISALKMENIRGQISPHFAFNVLNNIWSIIDDKDKAREHFDQLMNMIRHSLVNTEKIAITLKEEVEFVNSYLELQNFRMDGDLNIEWDIDPGMDLNSLVPGMIIHIPVENSIKHGLSAKTGKKALKISINPDNEFIIITIIDNGVGYNNRASHSKGTGTGLKILSTTIGLLNQTNLNKMSYEIHNLDHEGNTGTKVTVKIPLSYNYNLV